MTRFSVHTAETLLEVAELHWRAASRAAQTAQDEYDTARRMYASARSRDCIRFFPDNEVRAGTLAWKDAKCLT